MYKLILEDLTIFIIDVYITRCCSIYTLIQVIAIIDSGH